jgi:hypothetical protein
LGLEITVNLDNNFSWVFSFLLEAFSLAILGLYTSYLPRRWVVEGKFDVGFDGYGLELDIWGNQIIRFYEELLKGCGSFSERI